MGNFDIYSGYGDSYLYAYKVRRGFLKLSKHVL